MHPKDIAYHLQLQRYEVFKNQDLEKGHFDVIFDIQAMKLHAHKFFLSSASSTFRAMFSDTFDNQPIKIQYYDFNDFKEFLTFIYSGSCTITKGNILNLLALSEFYQIGPLKDVCDSLLSKMEIDSSNIYQLMDTANKYSLIQTKEPIQKFIAQNYEQVGNLEALLNVPKEILQQFCDYSPSDEMCEFVFQAVYKWAEHQSTKEQTESKDENFNLSEAIHRRMSPFVKYFQFQNMSVDFLFQFVITNALFLFSGNELSNVLDTVVPKTKVKITNPYYDTLVGYLSCDSIYINTIKSLKYSRSINDDETSIYWDAKCKIPSKCSSLKRGGKTEWYLLLDLNGKICVKRDAYIERSDYLIAQLSSEGERDFVSTTYCKIDIV